MIPQNTIDQILSTVNIEEYIGNDIEIKRAGVNYSGCCPFHNEKTPSFVVSPSKGIFKCFGCGEGGNIFQYVQMREHMTFPETIKHLAQRYNIAYQERKLTPQEKEEVYLKDSIFIANDAANKFFIDQLKNNIEAKQYVEKRWGKDIPNEAQIGYAPAGWRALMDFLIKNQFNKDVLFSAGLINKNEKNPDGFDVFVDRITIPIRNKSGHIIGFTARVFKGDAKPKFINTATTPVFVKGDELFGIFEAQKEARRADRIYLVEGGPDVIRLQGIGISNTVAPLGTELTLAQVKIIKRLTKNVTIIPDADNAGIASAQKSGKLLFANGCNVTVVSLDGSRGKDADEQFKSKIDFVEIVENSNNDFITWWSAFVMANRINESERLEGIEEICNLLATSDNENAVEMYIDSLSKIHKPKKVWGNALSSSRTKVKTETIKKSGLEEDDQFTKHGFFVKHNSYYGQTGRGVDVKWSNFIMEPLAHVRGINSKRLYLIRNEHKFEQTIEVKQEDLVSLQRFRVKTESMGNYLWEAGEIELHRLKRYLYENTLTCDEITQLGWQKKYGFFAWGNGGLYDQQFVKVNEIGILSIGKDHFYLPAFSRIFENDPQLFQFERRFVHAQTNGISLFDYSQKLITVFGDNAKIALCFLFSTLFKDVVIRQTKSFPILNLFGPKGTGKSELGHSLTSFFTPNNIPPNINNTTIPALAEAVAQVSNAIVHIDEYKNTIDLDRREFLKGLWDGAGRTRMNMDRDKKRETTTVDSGVVLSGQEMPTADNALFSRLIFLTFNKAEFSDSERKTFDELKQLERRGLTHLTNELLNLRKSFEAGFNQAYLVVSDEMTERLKGYSIEDRTFKNWVTMAATLKAFDQRLNIPFCYTEVMDICERGIVVQDAKTKENNELSGWWTTVESLVRTMQVIEGFDYKIKALPATALTGFKEKVALDVSKRYLLLQFNNIVPQYLKECRSTGAKQLPKDSLNYYLQNSAEYVGIKRSERFKKPAFTNSTAAKQNPSTPQTNLSVPTEYAAQVTTCMVFDYEAIVEKYNISIDEVYCSEEDI